jgi:L-fucose isomerase-like protein
MLDAQFDHLLLHQQLGIEVVDIPIQTYIDLYRAVPEADVAALARGVKERDAVKRLTEQDCLRSAKAYAVLRQLVETHELSAVTVRCWPELKEQEVVSPCLALSLLTDQGLPAGCEGDACGAISMLIAQLLTDRPAFFGDLVALDEVTDEVLMFHCGAGAAGLGEPGQPVTLQTHSRPAMWTPGATVEFPVGPGPATYLRLGEKDNGFRLLLTEGQALRHVPFCRGTTLRFKPVVGGRALLGGLMAAGAEHHQVVAQGEVMQAATVLCELWGVTPIRIKLRLCSALRNR